MANAYDAHDARPLTAALNVPSRADYNRLLAKIEALQGSLVNLSMKLDRLLAHQIEAASRHASAPPKRTRRPPRRKVVAAS